MLPEEDWIQLSSLQHFVFCPTQCGLIHVHGVWEENRFTAFGKVFHERVDSGEDERRGSTYITRSLNIYSKEFGLSGRADVVEFTDEKGTRTVLPVEYKSGKPKSGIADTVQLCAQALCLEEMTGIAIPEAAIFYGKTRHRLTVNIDAPLRTATKLIIEQVHHMILSREVPEARYKKEKCGNCSLIESCMPEIGTKKIYNYIRELYLNHEKTP